jgi:hypothetical protein
MQTGEVGIEITPILAALVGEMLDALPLAAQQPA